MSLRGTLRYADTAHQPWPLHAVEPISYTDGLFAADRFAHPDQEPVFLRPGGSRIQFRSYRD